MNAVLIQFWSVLLPNLHPNVENEDPVEDGHSIAIAGSGYIRDPHGCAHRQTLMMTRIEQIGPAAREILNAFVHALIAAKMNLCSLEIDE